MSDFIHGPQLSHPADGPGGLLSQDKPLNHGMNDAVSRSTSRAAFFSPQRNSPSLCNASCVKLGLCLSL